VGGGGGVSVVIVCKVVRGVLNLNTGQAIQRRGAAGREDDDDDDRKEKLLMCMVLGIDSSNEQNNEQTESLHLLLLGVHVQGW
jgi:hypothetical protein